MSVDLSSEILCYLQAIKRNEPPTALHLQAYSAQEIANALMIHARALPGAAAFFLEELLQEAPQAIYFEAQAHLLMKLGRLVEAKQAYKNAILHDPERLGACFGLAQCLQQEGQYAEAMTYLLPCVEKNPDEPVFLFQLGSCYLQSKDYSQAKNFLEKVLLKVPHHREAMVNLGSCFLQEKSYQEAIYHFATALRLDASDQSAQFNLIHALMAHRRYLQAKDQCHDYLQKWPEDADIIYGLAYVFLMLEDFIEAEKLFQQLLRQDNNNVQVMHNLACVAIKKNEPSVALGYYQRVLALSPEDTIAAYMSSALSQRDAPAQAPADYVKNLFDQYAEHFEKHLQEILHYETPVHLYRLWLKHASVTQACSVLDLGCGTGLMGAQLKPHAYTMSGVDLSCEMLKIAQEKNLYDHLSEEEIIHFLSHCDTSFDLIVLADVLVYFGDLEPLFQQLTRLGKAVLLSFELGVKPTYQLSAHGRYQHALAYVLDIAERHGFVVLAHKKVTLRLQQQEKVQGVVIYLEKMTVVS